MTASSGQLTIYTQALWLISPYAYFIRSHNEKKTKIIIYNQASYLIVVSPNKEQKRLVPTAVVLIHSPTEVKKLG